MWDLKFPDQGSKLRPLHWNCRVLTTGPPGESPSDKSFRETSSVLLTNQRSKGSTGFPWWLTWKRARLPVQDTQETWVSSLWQQSGNPLCCTCLENLMDRGAWWATVHGIAKRRASVSEGHFHFSWKWKLAAQSCPILCDPTGCRILCPWLLCPWNSPGKSTGVGCHFLLRGILLHFSLWYNIT